MRPAPSLRVEGLHVSHRVGGRRRLHALRGVDVSVWPGETLAVVGESGCGKSSFARAALRLIDPAAGRIHWGDREVTALGQAALRPLRRRVQLVFQDSLGALDPRMTAGEQIAEALAIHGLAEPAAVTARIAALLEQVGLAPELQHRRSQALSGGQRQRVGLARALAVDPELLILDEPVSALDVSVQSQVLNLLVELQRRRGLGYVFISHDLRLVRFLADRVAVFYFGRIVEEAGTTELFARPRHPYTRLLLASQPSLHEATEPEPLPEAPPPSPFEPPRGCPFRSRCPLAFERCAIEEPELVPLGASRAACFAAEHDARGAG
ncbi:MAG TPA: oligopeptide/dipeptide ABC transporter ATP-binding protein [Myxococcales bacterium]|nr:oligopeptide/dipeptide ABC transporter ATP-binding protein [Myxococcales bacterium]